ncbi:MAG TPA: DUF533 domain-containing protein [Steroidobacteraceae bacterium]|nr:DUF533 domain-containing protein [Steroidobacteraceae bacterium]
MPTVAAATGGARSICIGSWRWGSGRSACLCACAAAPVAKQGSSRCDRPCPHARRRAGSHRPCRFPAAPLRRIDMPVRREAYERPPESGILEPMDVQQTRSILTVALMAAFADGAKDERERESIRRLAETLGDDTAVDLPGLYRDVLLAKPDLPTVVASLTTTELRQFAYEMAVGVVNADGSQGAAEAEFLGRLAVALGLPSAASAEQAKAAADVADAAFETPASAGPATAAAATGTVLGKADVSDAELDQTILKASITNGALELLPETIASMAIIPLQMRLVYRIGQAYGYPMDRTHAKDFIATLGVGLTSQYVEQFGRKLLGGLLGGLGGGLGRAVGRQAASSGLSFATTYAIGRVAQRYYAGGRTLDAQTLKQTFNALLAEARGFAPQYQSQIQQAVRTIDTRNLASLVKQV